MNFFICFQCVYANGLADKCKPGYLHRLVCHRKVSLRCRVGLTSNHEREKRTHLHMLGDIVSCFAAVSYFREVRRLVKLVGRRERLSHKVAHSSANGERNV